MYSISRYYQLANKSKNMYDLFLQRPKITTWTKLSAHYWFHVHVWLWDSVTHLQCENPNYHFSDHCSPPEWVSCQQGWYESRRRWSKSTSIPTFGKGKNAMGYIRSFQSLYHHRERLFGFHSPFHLPFAEFLAILGVNCFIKVLT